MFRDSGDLSVLFHGARHGDLHQNTWGAYMHACVVYAVITREKFDGRVFVNAEMGATGDPDERRIVIPDACRHGIWKMLPGKRTSNSRKSWKPC